MGYRSCDLFLEDQLVRVRLMVQRYLRLHADRVVGGEETYGDNHVGRAEMRRLLLLEDDRGGHAWLDNLGVPSLKTVTENIANHDALVAKRLESTTIELPLEEIRARFGLTEIEVDVLLVAAAPRMSTDISRLYNVAWADFTIKQPTVGFLVDVVTADVQDRGEVLAVFSEHATLVRTRLLELYQHQRWVPDTPRLFKTVAVPDTVVDRILNLPTGPPRELATTLRSVTLTLEDLSYDDGVVEQVVGHMRRPQPRMILLGEHGSGRASLIGALAESTGQRVLEAQFAEAFSSDVDSGRRLAELLREATLAGAVLIARLDSLSRDSSRQLAPSPSLLRELFDGHAGPIVFTAQSKEPEVTRWTLGAPEIHFSALSQKLQLGIWRRSLEGKRLKSEVGAAELMAKRYQLSPGAIVQAVDRAITLALERRPNITVGRLEAAVKTKIVHGLDNLAEAVKPRLTLDDVVLPEDQQRQIQEILSCARHSDKVYNKWGFASHGARGLSVLFSGPPGTGKTMMSSVLARELGKTLYRIDLSRIVDKYIGETEKNLAKIFDEAEKAQAVLLFDEADSLFAGRTSVKSSSDRYANLEVNFLLQRLDEYAGVSILTTNFSNAIDDAFQRRIRFKIEFPKPEADLRADLWQKHVPKHTRDEAEIDWAALGERFDLTGGHIRNAALRAAFRAAEDGTRITEDLLFEAALSESRELGLLIPTFTDEY